MHSQAACDRGQEALIGFNHRLTIRALYNPERPHDVVEIANPSVKLAVFVIESVKRAVKIEQRLQCCIVIAFFDECQGVDCFGLA